MASVAAAAAQIVRMESLGLTADGSFLHPSLSVCVCISNIRNVDVDDEGMLDTFVCLHAHLVLI